MRTTVAHPASACARVSASVTVEGEANDTGWLKVSVDRNGPDVLSWDRVPYE